METFLKRINVFFGMEEETEPNSLGFDVSSYKLTLIKLITRRF